MMNSNKRDYDKEPIIIKDYTFYDYMIYQCPAVLVGFLIIVVFGTLTATINPQTFRAIPFIFVPLLIAFKERDKNYFVAKNNHIAYYHKNKIHKIFNISEIGAIAVSFDFRYSHKQKANILLLIATGIWVLFAFLARPMELSWGQHITNGLCLIMMILCGIFGAKAFMHIRHKSFCFFGLHDQIVLYKDNANVDIMNIMLAKKSEYFDLKEYFMQTLGKDLDSVPRTMSIFNKNIKFRKFNF